MKSCCRSKQIRSACTTLKKIWIARFQGIHSSIRTSTETLARRVWCMSLKRIQYSIKRSVTLSPWTLSPVSSYLSMEVLKEKPFGFLLNWLSRASKTNRTGKHVSLTSMTVFTEKTFLYYCSICTNSICCLSNFYLTSTFTFRMRWYHRCYGLVNGLLLCSFWVSPSACASASGTTF